MKNSLETYLEDNKEYEFKIILSKPMNNLFNAYLNTFSNVKAIEVDETLKDDKLHIVNLSFPLKLDITFYE